MRTDNREETVNLVVSQAQRLGLICQVSEQGKWTIGSTENWQLAEGEKQWLLSVKMLPQFYLSEAITFDFLKHQEPET